MLQQLVLAAVVAILFLEPVADIATAGGFSRSLIRPSIAYSLISPQSAPNALSTSSTTTRTVNVYEPWRMQSPYRTRMLGAPLQRAVLRNC